MGFANDIKAFQQKALEDANTSVCTAFETVSVSTVYLSPTPPGINSGYSIGTVKNQWYAAIASFDESVGTANSITGSASLASIAAIIAQKPFFGKDNFVTLTNSTSYVARVESLGWPAADSPKGWHWTGRAVPYAMVATSISNLIAAYQ